MNGVCGASVFNLCTRSFITTGACVQERCENKIFSPRHKKPFVCGVTLCTETKNWKVVGNVLIV